GAAAYRERIEAYMIKAAREAKLRTSWTETDAAYEEALLQFVRSALEPRDSNLFLGDFVDFQRRVRRFGLLNGLSQTLLKLTAPGVPDIYQGNEIWEFTLVDPDNRRPVDYGRRRALLAEVRSGGRASRGRTREAPAHLEVPRAAAGSSRALSRRQLPAAARARGAGAAPVRLRAPVAPAVADRDRAAPVPPAARRERGTPARRGG